MGYVDIIIAVSCAYRSTNNPGSLSTGAHALVLAIRQGLEVSLQSTKLLQRPAVALLYRAWKKKKEGGEFCWEKESYIVKLDILKQRRRRQRQQRLRGGRAYWVRNGGCPLGCGYQRKHPARTHARRNGDARWQDTSYKEVFCSRQEGISFSTGDNNSSLLRSSPRTDGRTGAFYAHPLLD